MALDQTSTAPPESKRSTFVTVVAWIFIACAGFATFISLLQALMFAFVFPAGELPPYAGKHPGFEEMPAVIQFLAGNIRLFFFAFWSLSVVTLVSAIGLLRRRNWARLVFIAFMVLGIIWNLGGIWLQQAMLRYFQKLPPNVPSDASAGIETMMGAMTLAMSAFAIAMTLVFAWIAKRLMSRSIKAEFTAP